MTLDQLIAEIVDFLPDAKLEIESGSDEIIIRTRIYLGPDNSVLPRGRTIPAK